MTMNDPKIETGIVALATMVEDRVPRNRKMTSTTSATVSTSVLLTSAIASRIKLESSEAFPNVTPGGNESRNDCTTLLMRSATSMVLAPGCLRMAKITLRRPLIQNMRLTLFELLNTSAT